LKAGVVDYGMGNLASVSKALERAGADPFVSNNPEDLARAKLVVLPGVGAFAAGMAELQRLGLARFLIEWAGSGNALLGICLGMQMLFEESEEGNCEGLGLVAGRVEKFKPMEKVPHMGWNSIQSVGQSQVFEPASGKQFYFVHSYACVATAELPGALTEYGFRFTSGLHVGRIMGVQFHPEKSSTDGLDLLKRTLLAAA